jgi:hypothetical protein
MSEWLRRTFDTVTTETLSDWAMSFMVAIIGRAIIPLHTAHEQKIVAVDFIVYDRAVWTGIDHPYDRFCNLEAA